MDIFAPNSHLQFASLFFTMLLLSLVSQNVFRSFLLLRRSGSLEFQNALVWS